jgi:hypothetical protein
MNKLEQAIVDNQIDIMLSEFEGMSKSTAKSFIEKALVSKEISEIIDEKIQEWYINNFKKYSFIINEETYLEAIIESLKIQFNIVGSDFGSSKQRDFGQKWSDTIRGYIGELGTKQVFERFNIKIDLGHEEGSLKDFLPQDIHKVKLPCESEFRDPKIKISIKSAKANGIWLDIPGDQINHSDIYILAKIGIGTDHLFSFFKHISVFKDKILQRGKDGGFLNDSDALKIYEKVPSFEKIYGYIPGFIEFSKDYYKFKYEGKIGKSIFKIFNWQGYYEEDLLTEIKIKEGAKKVKFEGIGNFSKQKKYVFGTKSLRNTEDEWNEFIFSKI